MKGWYIARDGSKHELESDYIINLSSMDIVKLVIPNGAKKVYCYNNKLTELVIPNGVIEVYCWLNKLTELYLPCSVEYIDCKNNQLTELIVSDNCEVSCDDHVNVINRTMYNRSKRLKNLLK